MWESDDRFDVVMAAELELLDAAARHDTDRLRQLLHPDFAEIGRSGRRWTRDEIIASLATGRERVTPETDEWLFNQVAPGLVLVTYRIIRVAGSSRHASLWDVSGSAPMIRYHQGTMLRRDAGE